MVEEKIKEEKMRVAHNVTAMAAWRQLTNISGKLGKSVERISSGYRINRAGDDPAGLVISENLRAQIVGLDQALANTQDGVSMIQTAEGALTEIHSLLDSMRSLALHAANTATITADAIAADQEQLDSAVESIQRIAESTAYAGKMLLDGSVGKKAEIKNTVIVGAVDVGKASAPGTTYVQVYVTTAATKANLGLAGGHNLNDASTGGVGHETLMSGMAAFTGGTTLNINGVKVTLTGGMTFSQAMIEINARLTSAGIGIEARFFADGKATVASAHTTISGGGDSGYIGLVHTQWGSNYLIDLYDEEGLIFVSGSAITYHDRGSDIGGELGYKRIDNSGTTYKWTPATGKDGLTLVADAQGILNGLEITLLSGSNTTSGAYTDVVRLYGDTTQFQIGANAGENYAFTINSMIMTELGITANAANGLQDLIAGNSFDLDSDPDEAISVIDQAIRDVSGERSKLGALQVNVLESNERNLSVARENLTVSEARIRDVDMAFEMMEFTKNQIMTQAATAMLAQANTLPQMVLTLIR